MKTLNVNGVELSFRDNGNGKPVVFLHAFPLNQTMWDDQLAEFSAKHRIITLDWRGFGSSSLGLENSSPAVFADDLAGLLDRLGIPSATICGLSMGGYAAFAFYRKYADRVNALILCDTRATADTEEGKQTRFEMAETARHSGASAMIEPMIPRLLGETTLQAQPHIVKRVSQMIEVAQPEGIAQALIGMAYRQDSTGLLSQITCPTLIVVGEEDKLTPPGDAEMMNQAITTSRLQIIQRAGHLPNLEATADFNRTVGKFLNQM